MADLKPTKVTGSCEVSQIKNPLGNTIIDVDALDTECRSLRQIETHVDTTNYYVGTGWTLTSTFPEMTNCKAGSLIQLTYHFPNRNNSTSWGGMYHEPQYSVNGGIWQSLGSSGYDGSVMTLRVQSIASYTKTILIDPGMTMAFTIRFRFYCRSYDGTTTINGSHDINTISGTAPLLGGVSSDQHYYHIIVEEYAKLA